MVYADRAFAPCKTALNEKSIYLNYCDKHSHVDFAERGIRFIKERVRCVRSMMPKKIKKVSSPLMKELVTSSVDMVNFIRRKGGVHPVMSARQIVTGRKMVIPPYPPGSYVYAVYGNHTSSIDDMRTFDALYLRPNKKGGGHFVYNIPTNKTNSTCRVIG